MQKFKRAARESGYERRLLVSLKEGLTLLYTSGL